MPGAARLEPRARLRQRPPPRPRRHQRSPSIAGAGHVVHAPCSSCSVRLGRRRARLSLSWWARQDSNLQPRDYECGWTSSTRSQAVSHSRVHRPVSAAQAACFVAGEIIASHVVSGSFRDTMHTKRTFLAATMRKRRSRGSNQTLGVRWMQNHPVPSRPPTSLGVTHQHGRNEAKGAGAQPMGTWCDLVRASYNRSSVR